MPREQLQCPERGDAVARVLRPAQNRQHVLDMGRLEEFEAAIFDEGNIAPAELDLEEVAVMRGAEQHRLPAQRDAGLAVVEHAVGDIPGLPRLVLDIGQEGLLRRGLGRI
jgi:hypothetical protein